MLGKLVLSMLTPLLLVGSSDAQGTGPPELEARWSLLAGARRMSDTTLWDDAETQFALGFEYNVGWRQSWGMPGVELGIAFSADTDAFDTDADLAVYELFTGMRYSLTLPATRLSPYVAGGVALVGATIDEPSTDSDGTVGYYGRAGFELRLGRRVAFGFDVRSLQGTDIELEGVEGDADATLISARWTFRL